MQGERRHRKPPGADEEGPPEVGGGRLSDLPAAFAALCKDSSSLAFKSWIFSDWISMKIRLVT